MIKLKSLLSEAYRTINYWMDSNGNMIKVAGHANYVIEHLDKDHIFYIDNDGLPILQRNGSVAEIDDVYDVAFKQHYIRIVVEGKTLYFSYDYDGYKPNNIQKREMRDFAIEHQLDIEDATTGRDVDF